MKRTLAVAAVLVLAVGAAAAVQAIVRQRQYRALLVRGDAALREDEAFGAIEAYSGAIALHPDSMIAYLRRGEAYQRRGDGGDLDEAARNFRAATALDPTAPRPLEELGDTLYDNGQYQPAASAYDRASRLDDRSARVAYKLALARYRDGATDAAMAALTRAIRLDDHMADAHYLLGLCLRARGQTDAALHELEHAVALAPAQLAVREELADLYRAANRPSDELQQLQALAGLDPGNVERQIALGLAHARLAPTRPEQWDLAILTLRSALERAQGEPAVYRALGQVWLDKYEMRHDRVDLGKAREALDRVAGDQDATSDTLALYGRTLLEEGELEDAERTLQRATERYPVEPSAFRDYADAAERQGHFDAARRALVAYGRLVDDPQTFVARASRIAALSLRLNDPASAVTWLERASASSPKSLALLASLADAQLRAGDPAAAQATVARGLEKDPRNALLLAVSRRLR